MARILILLPNLIFAAYCAYELNHRDWMPDLFIYRAGSLLGWRGEKPYSPIIADLVGRQYPGDDSLKANCGYFLPPQAIVLFGPFAAVPWDTARLLYTVACLGSVVLCWYGLTSAFHNRPFPSLEDVPLLLPWLVILHTVLRMTFDVGQTTILVAGAIVAGQLLHERNRPVLGAFCWASAFVKPHLALPLIPLAVALNGWRRGTLLLAWLAVLNVTGCLLAGVTPFDYLDHLAIGHKAVEFNRVALNPQITSWNRIVVSLGGPAIDLTMPLTLAGYAVCASMIVLRCGTRQPTPAWMIAIAVSTALVSCQVLGYELFLLVLLVPHLLDCIDRHRWVDFIVMMPLLLWQGVSLDAMAAAGNWLDTRFHTTVFWSICLSFRPWLVALLMLWLLARPAFPVHSPDAR